MQVISFGDKSALGSDSVTVSTTGSSQLTSTAIETSVGTNPTTRMEATAAFITSELADCRWTIDPALTISNTTIGHLLTSGSNLTLDGKTALKNFRARSTTATAPVLKVTYFGN